MADNSIQIDIKPAAIKHFEDLIAKEDTPGTGLRIFVDYPGSPKAEIGIAFCPPGDHRARDVKLDYGVFILYVDQPSLEYLQDASIDFQEDNMGGQLSITAPRLKGSKPESDASIAEKITYLLNSEINPNLASHGGMVSLVKVTEKNEVILQFGGGCQGCGMADVTLKEGIEKRLREEIPEIESIIDATDHASGENPYY